MALPSLNALRAFEAASRNGSFVAAATELGVTAAAVSMQVRNLERHLKKRLFLRSHNRITMTEAARALYPPVASAFFGLGAAVDRLAAPATRPRLIVSAPPALGERWLAPVVAAFRRVEPHVSIELRLEDDPVDMIAGRIDLRIAEDSFLYNDFFLLPLLHDAFLPLAAPGLAAAEIATELAQISDDRLIHVSALPTRGAQPTWSDWFAAAETPRRPDVGSGLKAPNHSFALALAARGAGVALGSQTLAAPEIASGTLAPLSRISVPASAPWVAAMFHARRGDRYVQRFVRSLEGAARAEGSR